MGELPLQKQPAADSRCCVPKMHSTGAETSAMITDRNQHSPREECVWPPPSLVLKPVVKRFRGGLVFKAQKLVYRVFRS
jgi:hypothetical protein